MTKHPTRLLSAAEMATLLSTSRKAIYAMNRRGDLPGATKIGRRLRFREDDLIEWLDEMRAFRVVGSDPSDSSTATAAERESAR